MEPRRICYATVSKGWELIHSDLNLRAASIGADVTAMCIQEWIKVITGGNGIINVGDLPLELIRDLHRLVTHDTARKAANNLSSIILGPFTRS